MSPLVRFLWQPILHLFIGLITLKKSVSEKQLVNDWHQ